MESVMEIELDPSDPDSPEAQATKALLTVAAQLSRVFKVCPACLVLNAGWSVESAIDKGELKHGLIDENGKIIGEAFH